MNIACSYGGNAILIPLRAPFLGTFWKSKGFNQNIKKTHVLLNQQRVLLNQQRVLLNQQRVLLNQQRVCSTSNAFCIKKPKILTKKKKTHRLRRPIS